jgi:hypothetical protein
MEDYRYYNSQNKFCDYSYKALQDNFASKNEFDSFYNSILKKNNKNEFLRITSFYLFLVKNGDWISRVNKTNKKVDYLDESYKFIGLLSLIESLNMKRYVDFYEYLISKKNKIEFPINKYNLETYYKNYNHNYGAIKKATSFFKFLKQKDVEALSKKLKIDKKSSNVENLLKYLYEIRSKFVHECKPILDLSNIPNISRKNGKIYLCNISLKDLMIAFEKGIINHFQNLN